MNFIKFIKEQIRVIKEKDPSIKNSIEVLLYPSFWALFWYRIARNLYLKDIIFWHVIYQKELSVKLV